MDNLCRLALVTMLIAGCDPGYSFDISLEVAAAALPDDAAAYPMGVAVRIDTPNPNRVHIDHPVVLTFCSPDDREDLTWERHWGGMGFCLGGLSATAWLGAVTPIGGVELSRRVSPGTRGKCEPCHEDGDCVDSMRCLHDEQFEEGRCFFISRHPDDVGPSCAGTPGFAEEAPDPPPACASTAPCPAGEGCSSTGCVPIPCDPFYYEMTPPTPDWTLADGPPADGISANAMDDMEGDPGSDGCALTLELMLGE